MNNLTCLVNRLFFVFLLATWGFSSFSQVKLAGRIKQADVNEKLSLILSNYVTIDEDVLPIELNQEQKFSITIPLYHPQFVEIVNNVSTQFVLLLFPGDSVYIDIDLKKITPLYLEHEAIILGSNAAGQKFFNKFNFYPIEKFYPVMDIFEKKIINENQLFNDVRNVIYKSLLPIDSLYKLGKVNKKFRDYMRDDLEAILACEAIKKCNARKSSLWAKPLKKKIFQTIYPYNPHLLNGLYGLFYTSNYLDYLAEEKKDKNQGQKISMHPYLDRYLKAPRPFSEIITAFFIKTFIPNMPEGVEGFHSKQVLDGFIRNFPNSRYIPHLKQLYRQKSFKIAPDSNVLKEVRFIDTAIHYRNLKELWTAQLKGRPVFIDLWATWCQPCLREFQHADTLYNLLQQKNIDLLYISIDKPALLAAWQEKARQYGLRGTHFLVNNEAFIQYLKKEIYKSDGISVPRYLLLDNRGNLVATDLERPANMQKLLAQLENLINK